jgi:hypothetical protein
MHKSTFVVLLLVLLHLFAARVEAQGWVDVSDPNNTPGGTDHAGMCFFPPGGYTLLVKGVETWVYDNTGWSQASPPTPPDPANPYVFAGIYGLSGPAGILASRLVYDESRQVALLAQTAVYSQGGLGACGVAYHVGVALYSWDGQDWTYEERIPGLGVQNCTSNIAARNFVAMAYDRTWGRAVIYTQGSTRTFDGVNITGVPVLIAPPTQSNTQRQLFYSSVRSRCVLVAQDPSSMWELDSLTNNWSQCFPSYLGEPITNGSFGPIAFSNTSNVGIGLGVDLPYTTRTLEYSGCEIGIQFLPTQPAVRTGYSIAYDSSRSRFVLHGGSNYADTWELELGPLATYTTTGTGCPGTGGTPTLQAANGSLPVAGSQFNVQVSGMPWNTPAFMFMGTSNTSYGGAPLPFDLAPIGAPGCVLRAPGTYLFGVPNVLGTGLWNYSIPYLPGQVFYNQAIIFDPAANSLGLTVSNVGEAVIGS